MTTFADRGCHVVSVADPYDSSSLHIYNGEFEEDELEVRTLGFGRNLY
jgi:hypothetical protein